MLFTVGRKTIAGGETSSYFAVARNSQGSETCLNDIGKVQEEWSSLRGTNEASSAVE